jgi:O-antigen ligase
VYQRGSTRLLLALSGIAGLILAKSVGSALALIIALALLYGLRNRAVRAGRAVVAFTVLFGLAIVFVAAFRPTSLPWNEEFSVNSGQQRLIEAYAGMHVFLQQPLIGVGWGQSGEAIGSPAVGSTVRQLFASANPLLYPDVQAAGVHNAYIQILAELGLIGGLLILWLIRNSFLASRAIVRFAVWWNETAFFGGQPETFLFAVVLGSLAVARSELGGEALAARDRTQGTKESRLIARAPS